MGNDSPLEMSLFRPGVRLSSGYFVTSALQFCDAVDLDLGPALVLTALMSCNVANGLKVDAAPLAPGVSGVAPSSIYAVARRTRLAYETTRRHIRGLEVRGLCSGSPEGYVVGSSVLASPQFASRRLAIWSATQTLRHDLVDLGVSVPSWSAVGSEAALIALSRLATPHLVDGLWLVSDALGVELAPSLLFLAIIQENALNLTRDLDLARQFSAPDVLLPDHCRRPISMYRLAQLVRMPYETARRHAHTLIDAGVCRHERRAGLVVPARALRKPELAQAAERSWAFTVKFLHDVSQIADDPGASEGNA